MSEKIFRTLYAKSLRYLGVRLRTEHEMRKKLDEWSEELIEKLLIDEAHNGEDQNDGDSALRSVIERVVAQLKREGFLNDERFARNWVEGRVSRGRKGPAVIRVELIKKGLSSEVIEGALAEVMAHQKGGEEPIVKAANKYLPRLKGDTGSASKSKMVQFLVRRGFKSIDAYRVVKELVGGC